MQVDYTELTQAQRREVRLQYVALQKGKCFYCTKPLDGRPSNEVLTMRISLELFPTPFFKHPVHLHHDHVTGLTIGAVHALCNAVLWQYHGE